MSGKRSSAALVAEIIAAIMWGPKTRAEIVEFAGVRRNHCGAIAKYLLEFHQSGCIYIVGYTARHQAIYAWQSKPFAMADAPSDRVIASHAEKPKVRANGVLVTVGGEPMTRRQAADRLGLSLETIDYRRRNGVPLTNPLKTRCRPAAA